VTFVSLDVRHLEVENVQMPNESKHPEVVSRPEIRTAIPSLDGKTDPPPGGEATQVDLELPQTPAAQAETPTASGHALDAQPDDASTPTLKGL
jgi:hypothetical protein